MMLKPTIFGVSLLLIVVGTSGAIKDLAACTSDCDDLYPASASTSYHPATLCGTDYQTHHTTTEALDTDYCYAVCGVMSQYQGSCGCPNDCMSALKQGSCSSSSNLCDCAAGWQGQDCSLPAVGNKCSLHGELIVGGSKGSAFSFDYCQCDEGWTGVDCSSAILRVGALPWGELFPESGPAYSSGDQYKDDHPIWNLSQLATIRMELDEKDYVNLLLPENLYNESYASANMHFDNGQVRQSLYNVGFRIKGAYSRMDQKKGWALKFNEFVSGQKFFDMKKIAMKAGSVDDDTLLKTKLFADFVRAVGVPTQRSSYALLYINNKYAGIYYLHEDIGPEFMKSRLSNDDGKGNLMKYFWNVHFAYFGPDVTYYQTKAHVNELGVPMYYYEQSDGNGDWTDIMDFQYYLNTTTNISVFDATIDDHLDMSTLIRAMIVESFMVGSDNSASGANFYTYHRSGSSTSKDQWVLFDADFDECFAFDPVTHEPTEADPDLISFFSYHSSDFDDNCPFYDMMLSTGSKYRKQYLEYYKSFVTAVFGSQSKQQPSDRYAAMMQFILPWIKRDQLWQMSFGITTQDFVLDAERTIANLPGRYQDVMKQLDSYLQV